jgi:polar amino acid transport system permease protein
LTIPFYSNLTRRERARLRRWALYGLFVAIVVFVLVNVDYTKFSEQVFDVDVAKAQFPDVITQGARNTLIFTFFGFTGGLALGLLIALMRLSTLLPYRWFATAYIELFRGLPALLTILMIGYIMPITLDIRVPWTYGAGSVALALVAGAYMAETIRAGIEAVPKGQVEAARSLGMSEGRAMVSIVIPQAFRIMIPPLTNELVLLVKDTSLLAALGTTTATKELLKFGREGAINNVDATPLVVAGFVYLVFTIPLGRVAAWLERRGKRAR